MYRTIADKEILGISEIRARAVDLKKLAFGVRYLYPISGDLDEFWKRVEGQSTPWNVKNIANVFQAFVRDQKTLNRIKVYCMRFGKRSDRVYLTLPENMSHDLGVFGIGRIVRRSDGDALVVRMQFKLLNLLVVWWMWFFPALIIAACIGYMFRGGPSFDKAGAGLAILVLLGVMLLPVIFMDGASRNSRALQRWAWSVSTGRREGPDFLDWN